MDKIWSIIIVVFLNKFLRIQCVGSFWFSSDIMIIISYFLMRLWCLFYSIQTRWAGMGTNMIKLFSNDYIALSILNVLFHFNFDFAILEHHYWFVCVSYSMWHYISYLSLNYTWNLSKPNLNKPNCRQSPNVENLCWYNLCTPDACLRLVPGMFGLERFRGIK